MKALLWIAAAVTLLMGISVPLCAMSIRNLGPVVLTMVVATVISYFFLLVGNRKIADLKHRGLLLMFVLPALWAVHSVWGFSYPGRDYLLYIVGSWPGGPWLTMSTRQPPFNAGIVALVGLVPMVAMGYTLFQSGVALRGFVYAAIVAFVIVFVGYAAYPIQHGGFARLAKHGSLWGYYFAAFNFSLVAQAPGVVLSLLFRKSRAR